MQISIIDDWRVNEDKSGHLNKVDSVFEGDFVDLIEKRLTNHTTHGIFVNNNRLNDNFVSSDILVIDFDKGLISYSEVAERVGLYNFAITASSNHLKDKGDGKGAIERFHIIIELAQSVFGVDNYKDLVKYAINQFKFNGVADDSSANATRYWKKQKDLLIANENGKALNIEKIVHFLTLTRENGLIKSKKYDCLTNFSCNLFVKTHKELIESLSKPGGRNNAVCKLIGIIKKLGFGELEVREVLLGRCTLPPNEVNNIIRQFLRKA